MSWDRVGEVVAVLSVWFFLIVPYVKGRDEDFKKLEVRLERIEELLRSRR